MPAPTLRVTDLLEAAAQNLEDAFVLPDGVRPERLPPWSGPRLLVPVCVDALVVRPEDAAATYVRLGPADLDSPPAQRQTTTRPAGVHLHWALPDALTRALKPASDQDEPRASLRFRPAPERWLVVRIAPGADAAAPRQLHSWDVGGKRRTAVGPLEEGAAQHPVYGAVYDCGAGAQSFHDPLDGVTSGPLTYVVLGWYGDFGDDPLAVADLATWQQVVSDLGLSVAAPTDELKALWLATASAATPHPALDPSLAPLEEASQSATASSDPFSNLWPRQILCHGMVYDVAWRNKPLYQRSDVGVPAADAVKVALGATTAASLATLLANLAAPTMTPALNETQIKGFEQLLVAAQRDALDELEQPDGWRAIAMKLHEDEFFALQAKSQPVVFERPVTARKPPGPAGPGPILPPRPPHGPPGPILPPRPPHGPPGPILPPRPPQAATPAIRQSRLALPDLVAPLPAGQRDQLGPVAGDSPTVIVPQAEPRWWRPKNPAIALGHLRRSFRHGGDGRFAADGTLACRLTGETISSLTLYEPPAGPALTLHPSDAAAQDLAYAGCPPEARALVHEALLLDEHSAAPLNAAAHRLRPQLRVNVVDTIRAQQTLCWLAGTGAADTRQVITGSCLAGKVPSKVAVQIWAPAWVPLLLDWEADVYPAPTMASWALEDPDYTFREGGALGPPARLGGRTLLTGGASAVLAGQLLRQATRASADSAEGRDLGKDLAQLARSINDLDVLSASLNGLNERVIGLTGGLRAGFLVLRELCVIDCFGQTCTLTDGLLSMPLRALSLLPATTPSLPGGLGQRAACLAPRLARASRITLRLRSPDDTRDADGVVSPVCGWLVPDHLDQALELYDAAGECLGQVRRHDDELSLAWEGVPGAATTAPPASPLLRGIVDGLLSWGTDDALTGLPYAGGRPKEESALSAMLRLIDSTLWTVDHLGRTGDEFLALLLGRPLAVVRAEITLEIGPLPGQPLITGVVLPPALASLAMPVRLGDATDLSDGLIGYFLDDDYSRFYPIHEDVAQQAPMLRPGIGFLGGREGAPERVLVTKPIVHPYVSADDAFTLTPGRTRRLTLVLDPRGGVSLAPGFLPNKRIDLLREHTAPALGRFDSMFRVGPVLVNPKAIRLPTAPLEDRCWEWIGRDGVARWAEPATVAPLAQSASLDDQPASIVEGWLRVSDIG